MSKWSVRSVSVVIPLLEELQRAVLCGLFSGLLLLFVKVKSELPALRFVIVQPVAAMLEPCHKGMFLSGFPDEESRNGTMHILKRHMIKQRIARVMHVDGHLHHREPFVSCLSQYFYNFILIVHAVQKKESHLSERPSFLYSKMTIKPILYCCCHLLPCPL